MNEFSIICRILGSLFYRQPQDPLLGPLLTLIKEGKLAAGWALDQDELFIRLQQSTDQTLLSQDYQRLFIGHECLVPPYRSAWQPESHEQEIREFLSLRGMPQGKTPADHFGSLLLAASWLEDQSQENEFQAQITLFDNYILSWANTFLGKVEALATSDFYRTLAIITREALQVMRDELQETENIYS